MEWFTPYLDELKLFTQKEGNPGYNNILYGATDAKAIEMLSELLNTEIKVSMILREPGFMQSHIYSLETLDSQLLILVRAISLMSQFQVG